MQSRGHDQFTLLRFKANPASRENTHKHAELEDVHWLWALLMGG